MTTPYPANSRFCNGLSIGPGTATTVDLSPGTYWITDGDLKIRSNGTLKCTLCNGTNLGVTIIFTAGPLNIIGTLVMSSNAVITTLNAPNSGAFAGLLFVQDTINGATYLDAANGNLQGGPGVNFVGTGLMYFPHTAMQFQGNPSAGTSGCLLLVADTMTLQGNSNLASSGCTAAGLGGTPTIKTVALAE